MTSSVSLEQQIVALRRQEQEALRARATALHQREVAEATVRQVEGELQAEFGVSAAEAPARLAELDAQAAAEVARVQQLLAQAEGQGSAS